MSDATQYWRENRELRHITPPGSPSPEGMYLHTYIATMFEGQNVTDFGCGTGRLAPCFQPSLYKGLDINPVAVRTAKMMCPLHDFFTWDGGPILGDVFFLHTVLLHVDDDDIDHLVSMLNGRRVVISEIMDRSLRRPEQTSPFVFNRSLNEYERIMREHDFELEKYVKLPYEHYHGAQLTIAAFERV